jgi:hypothetical protein
MTAYTPPDDGKPLAREFRRLFPDTAAGTGGGQALPKRSLVHDGQDQGRKSKRKRPAKKAK